MPEAAYSSNMTEAVAVFHNVETFQAAIDELLLAGFDYADINVLAQEDTIASKLGPAYSSTAKFEDDPEAPRIANIANETIGNAEGAVIGAGVYVPAMFGSLAVAASGGTLPRRFCGGGDCWRRRRPDRGGTGTVHRPRARKASRSASAARRPAAVGQNAGRRPRTAGTRNSAPPFGSRCPSAPDPRASLQGERCPARASARGSSPRSRIFLRLPWSPASTLKRGRAECVANSVHVQ